jgi:hypothetical protein
VKRLCALLALAACGGHEPQGAGAQAPVIVVPPRAATAGDDVLANLPAGADVLVELDLARLRGNDTVGDLAAELLADPAAQTLPFIGSPELAHASRIVIASYDVGTADAHTLTLTDDEEAPPLDGASLADDTELLALRARAMPAKADGAVLRVTARLDFDARVSLANQLQLDDAPAAISLWGDVADDLAIVADVDAPDTGANSVQSSGGAGLPGADGAVGDEVGRAMTARIEQWRDDEATVPEIVALDLGPAVQDIQVTPRGEGVRIVGLIGPRRLGRAVERAELARKAFSP